MGKFSGLKNLLVEPIPEVANGKNGNLEEVLNQTPAPKQIASLSVIHRSRFQKYPPLPQDVEKIRPSIAALGILEDLLARPHPDKPGELELMAGHTRLEAALLEGLEEAPIKVFDASDEIAVEIVTATNLQRRTLNPIAETDAILELLSVKLKTDKSAVIQLFYQLGNGKKNVLLTPEWNVVESVFQTATRISPETFRVERLPLLNLPLALLEAVRAGRIEYTKAKTIARVKDPDKQQSILEQAIEERLTLSQIRQLIALSKPSTSEESIKTKITQTLQLAKKAKLDPDKQQQLSHYLDRIRLLIEG